MRILSLGVIVLAVPLMAVSCTKEDAFTKACQGLIAAHAVFAEVREQAPAGTVKVVDAAFDNVEPFCSKPPVNTTEAAVRITAASLAIWKAYRSVKS